MYVFALKFGTFQCHNILRAGVSVTKFWDIATFNITNYKMSSMGQDHWIGGKKTLTSQRRAQENEYHPSGFGSNALQ